MGLEGVIKVAGSFLTYIILLSILHLYYDLSYIFHSHVKNFFVHIFVEEGTVLIDNCKCLFICILCSWLCLICLAFFLFYLLSYCVLEGKLHEGWKDLCKLSL